jgi:hypothetical protein
VSAAAAHWAAIADLAADELALARAGRWDELAERSGERVRRAAALGAPPLEARPELQRLAALQDALLAVVAGARSATVRELAALRGRRGAARGYAATTAQAAPAASRVDGRG